MNAADKKIVEEMIRSGVAPVDRRVDENQNDIYEIMEDLRELKKKTRNNSRHIINGQHGI